MLAEIETSIGVCPVCQYPDDFHRSDCQCVRENADIAMERSSIDKNTHNSVVTNVFFSETVLHLD